MSDPAHRGQGVSAPHLVDLALDPIWAYAEDVTTHHADSECTVYAFGRPKEMPLWNEPRVRWMEVTVCAEFDAEPLVRGVEDGNWIRRATDWFYNAYIIDDADAIPEHSGDGTWAETQPFIRAFWEQLQSERLGDDPGRARAEQAYRKAVGLNDNPSPQLSSPDRAASAKARLLRWT